MGCNCKTSKGSRVDNVNSESNQNYFELGVKFLVKLIGFFIALSLTPLIMLVIIWLMFDTIVLNKDIDLTKILDKFVNKAKYFNEYDEDDDDDDDYVDINTVSQDDVVLLNAEDITDRKK